MNPYFKDQLKNPASMNLYKNAATDIIEQNGIKFNYLERSIINSDLILGDTLTSSFDSDREVTMFIDNFNGFGGDGDLFGAFGFNVNDSMDLLISTNSVKELKFNFKESDLLYCDINNKLYEIKDVQDENEFIQIGGISYWYKIKVELFNYSDETFNTGNSDIDDVDDDVDDSNLNDEFDEFETARNLFM